MEFKILYMVIMHDPWKFIILFLLVFKFSMLIYVNDQVQLNLEDILSIRCMYTPSLCPLKIILFEDGTYIYISVTWHYIMYHMECHLKILIDVWGYVYCYVKFEICT